VDKRRLLLSKLSSGGSLSKEHALSSPPLLPKATLQRGPPLASRIRNASGFLLLIILSIVKRALANTRLSLFLDNRSPLVLVRLLSSFASFVRLLRHIRAVRYCNVLCVSYRDPIEDFPRCRLSVNAETLTLDYRLSVAALSLTRCSPSLEWLVESREARSPREGTLCYSRIKFVDTAP